MAILTAGSSITLTLTDSDSVTINTAGVLTLTAVSGLGVAAGKIGEFGGSRTFGPYAAGQLTLAASVKDCYYEVADGPIVSKNGTLGNLMRRLRSAAESGALPVPAAPVITAAVTGSWTPTAVPATAGASTTPAGYGWSEQVFTVAAMQPGDVITSVTPPSAMTSLAAVSARWVSTTQVAVTFKNGNTSAAVVSQTPPAGTWTVNIARFAAGLPADVPLVTLSAQGAASALSNVNVHLAGSGNVRMRHPYVANSGFGASYALSSAITISPGFKFGYYQGVEFMTDAPKMEILTSTFSGPFTVIVDGKYALAAPIASSGKNDSGYRVTIDFTQGGAITLGARKARKIRFEVGGSGHFGGLVVTKADSVWVPTNPNAIKGVINGDSYVQGTATQHPLLGVNNYTQEGFGNRLGDLLGWDECVNVGVASTGYLANASGGSLKFRDRITDIISQAPDIICVFGSINDRPFAPAAVQAEVTLYYQQLTAALPNAVILVAGVQLPRDSYDIAATNMAVKNGIAAVGSPNLFFIDMQNPTPWVSGTGASSAPTGDGNADVVTGPDLTHSTMDGHDYYKLRLGSGAAAIFKANA